MGWVCLESQRPGQREEAEKFSRGGHSTRDSAQDSAVHRERRRGRRSNPDTLEAPLPALQPGSELCRGVCAQPDRAADATEGDC